MDGSFSQCWKEFQPVPPDGLLCEFQTRLSSHYDRISQFLVILYLLLCISWFRFSG